MRIGDKVLTDRGIGTIICQEKLEFPMSEARWGVIFPETHKDFEYFKKNFSGGILYFLEKEVKPVDE